MTISPGMLWNRGHPRRRPHQETEVHASPERPLHGRSTFTSPLNPLSALVRKLINCYLSNYFVAVGRNFEYYTLVTFSLKYHCTRAFPYHMDTCQIFVLRGERSPHIIILIGNNRRYWVQAVSPRFTYKYMQIHLYISKVITYLYKYSQTVLLRRD